LPIGNQALSHRREIDTITDEREELIEASDRERISLLDNICDICISAIDSGSDFEMLHLGTICSDECFLDPGIEYLLISEYYRQSIHLRIALQCLPIYLRIDEAFHGILRSIDKRVIELGEDTSREDIESLRFEHISERLSSGFF
jgi:hypothetical protein